MGDIWYFILSYMIIIALGFFIINFMTKGFLIHYLRAKLSRGKYVLIQVQEVNGESYTSGQIRDNSVQFKGRDGRKRVQPLKVGDVRRLMNVDYIYLDLTQNQIKDPRIVNNMDSGDIENLINKALMAPKLGDTKEKLEFGIMVLVLIITAVNAYLSWMILQAVQNGVGKI